LGTVLVAAAACGFPNVAFDDEGVTPGVEGGTDADATGEAGDSGGDESTRPANPDVDPDGGSSDAATLGDATTVIDAAGCISCDCDEDGFDRLDLAAGCDGGGSPGKAFDCDDTVKAINPGQTGFVVDPWPPGSKHAVVGDWDCSGQTTKQYDYNAACASLSLCSTGFVDNPPCGGSTTYLTCEKGIVPLLGLTCSEKTREPPPARKQGCH